MTRSTSSEPTLEDGLLISEENVGSKSQLNVTMSGLDSTLGNYGNLNANGKVFLSVEDMLVKHVGEFGKGQMWHFVLVSLAWTLDALHTMVMIFGDQVPAWRCSSPTGGMNDHGNSCSSASSMCELPPGAWEWVDERHQSTVSEWNLVCNDEYKVGLAGSLFFIGGLLGAGLYGNLSDSVLGRKGSLAISCMGAVICGFLTSIVPSYWLYAALRFGTGLNCAGIGLCSFVLATEIVGPNKRGPVGMSTFYFFSTGIMLVPAFAYFTPSWRYLYAASSIPGLLYCVLVLPFLWESPRWYLVKGRLGDAMRVMRYFAKFNGSVIPQNVYLQLDDCGEGDEEHDESDQKADETWKQQLPNVSADDNEVVSESTSLITSSANVDYETKSPDGLHFDEGLAKERAGGIRQSQRRAAQGTLLDVFRYGPTRWRMILLIFIWFSTAIVYYGISLNVVNIGVNLYISVFVNGLIELPAFAITACLLQRLGRKIMLVSAMALSGVCCLLGSIIFIMNPLDEPLVTANATLRDSGFLALTNSNVPFLQQVGPAEPIGLKANVHGSSIVGGGEFDLLAVMRLACGVAGIFGMAGTYNLIFIYTLELFPTVVRNAAMGLASQAANIGSITAPLIVVTGHSTPFLPFLIFGALALSGASLASRLPETLNAHLHETMSGMQKSESTRLESSDPELPRQIPCP